MKNTEITKEIQQLKLYVNCMDDHLTRIKNKIYILEETLLDKQDEQWKKIGLNAVFLRSY